jgi:hypothetical protein
MLVAHYADVMTKLGLKRAASTVPDRPKTTPWVATALFAIMPLEAEWTGDFERCVAHSWADRVTVSN